MNTSLYQLSVPIFLKGLGNLSQIIYKAQDYSRQNNIDELFLTHFRLYPNMFNFIAQVQFASDFPKRFLARLTDSKIPNDEDNESSFKDLILRLTNSINYIKCFSPEQINSKEQKLIITNFAGKEVEHKCIDFLLEFTLPNMYFHISTAYNILRHNGLDIGKNDYLKYEKISYVFEKK
tara:strand:+ start:301 stop:834 length:534 start_codon:yes stop_codon:yes gene_type:complete